MVRIRSFCSLCLKPRTLTRAEWKRSRWLNTPTTRPHSRIGRCRMRPSSMTSSARSRISSDSKVTGLFVMISLTVKAIAGAIGNSSSGIIASLFLQAVQKAAQDIHIGDDPDQPLLVVDHRDAAHLLLDEELYGLAQLVVRRKRDRAAGHHRGNLGVHRLLPLLGRAQEIGRAHV